VLFGADANLSIHSLIEQTATGMGYELVEIERSAGGLLRVSIDWPWQPDAAQRFITVEDCEKLTRQLQFALEVEAADYRRLEVSSPGIDRLLRTEAQLERFIGEVVDISLKAPIGAGTVGVSANRKKFRGQLERADEAWQIVWRDEPERKPGQRVSKKRADAPWQALRFMWAELREVRLAPIVSFKGKECRAST